ncbi:uncharacterized protein TRIADDRAFT_52245 [Trichoplax adhaerens]|uniref:Protein kinase domain-containing protein n=1 Tax=Trichoplax adhaerens TaxID=10228 RepID=B3RM59_TRIAD|nr:hypothetical protein TRIADDRAFT_52245 [Trichoplax adhaerens]EDV29639.1 hypothetical protein TRIADDRAFT_52245 [Trichoplax adhaerens]|eukprot:XP_002108841.1 hypothetical protein TRIADDRAFT_52245 [Trichoplax adhaerens]
MSEKNDQTTNLTESLKTGLQDTNKDNPVYDKAAVLTAVANLANATADAVSAAKVDSVNSRPRVTSSSSLDSIRSCDSLLPKEEDFFKERSKTIESTYHTPRPRPEKISHTMVHRKLPQIPKESRSASVATSSPHRNTIHNLLDTGIPTRNRNRTEDSNDHSAKGVALHNRKLPEIPKGDSIYRLSNSSTTSRSTSDLRSFQDGKPKSFSNRELPEIPKNAEGNAAKILKSVQGQHLHVGSSTVSESATENFQTIAPSRQGPLPPVPPRDSDPTESKEFANRPYVRLDSFSNSDSEDQISQDQNNSQANNNNLQIQVDSAEENKDKKLSVGMLAPWKWAKKRRAKHNNSSDNKTDEGEDEDSDSRSDSTLNAAKGLSHSTGNLSNDESQDYYPLRKSSSMPLQDEKSNDIQFLTLTKESSSSSNRKASGTQSKQFKLPDNSTIKSNSNILSSSKVADISQKKSTVSSSSIIPDDDYVEPLEIQKIITEDNDKYDFERPIKSRLKRRTARRSKVMGPQLAISAKRRPSQAGDSDETKEEVKEEAKKPFIQKQKQPSREPTEGRRNSANRNFVVLSFIDGGASTKKETSFFANLNKPVRLLTPMLNDQGEEAIESNDSDAVLSVLSPTVPTELVYNVNARESISETLPLTIFQKSNLDSTSYLAQLQLATMTELNKKWKKAAMPSIVKASERNTNFYQKIQWSDLLLIADINNRIPCLITPHGCYISVKISGQENLGVNRECMGSVKIEPNQHHVSNFAEKLLIKHDIRVSTTLQYHRNVCTTVAHFKEKLPLAMHSLVRNSTTNINLNNPVSCLLLDCSPICTVKQYVDNCVRYHDVHPLEYEFTVVMLALQLCYGLQYLHSVKVVHRDLSLDNLLLVKSQDDLYAPVELSITNFSYSLHQVGVENPFKISINAALANIGGNTEHLPPEIVNVHETSTELDYQYCDQFAAGCIIYEMLHLDNPFADPTVQLAMQDYRISDLPLIPIRSALSQSIERIAFAFLNRKPEERLTIERAIRLLGFILWGPEVLKSNNKPPKTQNAVTNWLICKRQEFLCYLVEKSTSTFLDDSIEVSSFGSVFTLEESLKLHFLTHATSTSLLEDWTFLTAPLQDS